MSEATDRLVAAKERLARHDKRGKLLKAEVDAAQQAVWAEIRPSCSHVSMKIGDDWYVCMYCNTDMST